VERRFHEWHCRHLLPSWMTGIVEATRAPRTRARDVAAVPGGAATGVVRGWPYRHRASTRRKQRNWPNSDQCRRAGGGLRSWGRCRPTRQHYRTRSSRATRTPTSTTLPPARSSVAASPYQAAHPRPEACAVKEKALVSRCRHLKRQI
jgi:hypothetical protein